MSRLRLKDYKRKVKAILADYEESRNDDGLLIAHFLARHAKQLLVKDINGKWAIPLRNLQHTPPLNSITRARRIIQNDDNEYLPTNPAVRRARGIKETNYRNWEVREAQNS